MYISTHSASGSRSSLTIIAGLVFLSALLRTFYHEHISAYFPFDDEVYLRKLSTLRLIIAGALVGTGSQLALSGREGTGVLGVPAFTLKSLTSTIAFFGSAMLTVTLKWGEKLPRTPRIIEIANRALPKNISFDSYMLVTLLVPFICFLIAPKKSLKGMIESLTHFLIGMTVGAFLMLLGTSTIQGTYGIFSYSKEWTGEIIVAYSLASLIFGLVYTIVKYGLYLW